MFLSRSLARWVANDLVSQRRLWIRNSQIQHFMQWGSAPYLMPLRFWPRIGDVRVEMRSWGVARVYVLITMSPVNTHYVSPIEHVCYPLIFDRLTKAPSSFGLLTCGGRGAELDGAVELLNPRQGASWTPCLKYQYAETEWCSDFQMCAALHVRVFVRKETKY